MNKTLSCFSIAALAAVTLFTVPPARALPGPSPAGYGQAWAVPPGQLQGVERQGFLDGIEGARKDAQNHRPFNVENRDEYRHPSFKGPDRAAYRRGFRRGYAVGVRHLTGR